REFLHRTGSRTAPGGVDSHSGPGRARILRVVGAVVRMAKGRTWNAVRGYEDAVGERDCHSGGTTGGGTAIRCTHWDGTQAYGKRRRSLSSALPYGPVNRLRYPLGPRVADSLAGSMPLTGRPSSRHTSPEVRASPNLPSATASATTRSGWCCARLASRRSGA